jgi:uncharacterized cupin superfamily protein
MLPNTSIDATSVALSLEALPADRVIDGTSRAGATPITSFAGISCGIWEITPGISSDVEVDEMFVVLSGRAVVSFHDGSPDMHLGPGSIARLAAGSNTVWVVTETLRKVYLLEAS